MLSRPILTVLLTILLVSSATLATLVVDFRNAGLYASQREQIHSEAHAIKAHIDKLLTNNIGSIRALSGLTKQSRGLDKKQFPTLIKNILPPDHSILEVQLTRGTVITHISELPDRFQSLGLDLSSIALQKNDLIETIKERRLRVAGPFPMVGADKNIVIARNPIFINDQFFGFSMYLIDFDAMINKIKTKRLFAIRSMDRLSNSPAFFGPDDLFRDKHSLIIDVPLADSGWQMALQFVPSLSSPMYISLIYGFSFLFAIACCALIILTNKFQKISIRDPLTGAYNRRYMSQVYGTKPYCYALCADLDHFKNINDSYGHGMGDTVLEKFVMIIKSHVRPCDIVIRLGGEEFLILLEVQDDAIALTVAERIREATEQLRFREGCLITTSIGMTMINSKELLQDVLQRTDALLYQAKSHGRNTVESDLQT